MIPKFRLFSEKYGIREVSSMSFCDKNIYASFVDGINAPVRVKNPAIMQITGLFDKNNVEIFECDIVEFEFENKIYKSMVFFEDVMFKVEIKEDMIFSLAEVIESVKVIGNVFENEDLLE